MTAIQPGSTILAGTTPPDPNVGTIGDYWLDRVGQLIYGPKDQDGWGVGIPIAGGAQSLPSTANDGETLLYDATTGDWAASKFRHVHVQSVASDTWSITHNLASHPHVTIVDSGDNLVFGDVTHLSDNVLTISFSAPFGGTAYLS